jgi:hypothetical protein
LDKNQKMQFPVRAADAGMLKIIHLPCEKDKVGIWAEGRTERFFMIQKANILDERDSIIVQTMTAKERHGKILLGWTYKGAAGSLPRSLVGSTTTFNWKRYPST